MKTPSIMLALSLALVAASAVPAFAGDRDHKHDKAAFPMKADAFQERIEARLAHAKARVEKRIAESQVDAAQAKEMRDRADARATKIRAAATAAEQDGIVTADEAKAVRTAGGGGGEHCKHGGGGEKKS